jgi:hypothetical protein
MKTWDTFGAFGDTVVELSWRDILRLLRGHTLQVRGKCIAISFGKSNRTSLLSAPTREQQL